MRWSLKSRLSFALALSGVLMVGLQWAVASLAIERLTSSQLLARLERDAESLVAGAYLDAQGTLQIDPARVSAVYQRPFSGYYYAVRSGEQIISSRSLWDTTLTVPTLVAGGKVDMQMTGPEQHPLLLQARAYRKQGREMTIAVGEDLSELNAGLRNFQLLYGAVSALVLGMLLLVQRAIVSRSLRPIEVVRENMVRLERGELARIETAGPAEIAPLIAEFNRLLDSMIDRSRRSREALANLAHALKTRLTVLGHATQAPELAAHPSLRQTLQASAEEMRAIVERELKRARLSGSAMPGQRVNLQIEIDELVQTLQAIYRDKSLHIDWEVAPEAQFKGDREDLLEMLGNLLDNACKWSRGRVQLSVSALDGACFVIEDDGPGAAAEALAVLTDRGFRADESKPGSGLGLAIVRDMVEGYAGTLSFGRSATLGGMRVEVRLPDPTKIPG
ncbi:MAG: sensor histidine kinase [Betaproteobacteria bacterium]